MPRVRGGGGTRWVNRSSMSVDEYKDGIQNPRADWQQATTNATQAYNIGVQEAISDDRFKKGVQKAGTAKWQQKAITKGAARYPSGIQEGKNDYEANVQPYLDVINNVVLPPRYAKGDPRNIQRVMVITQALRAKKLAGG